MWNVSSARFQKNIAWFVFKWLIWKKDVLRNEEKKNGIKRWVCEIAMFVENYQKKNHQKKIKLI